MHRPASTPVNVAAPSQRSLMIPNDDDRTLAPMIRRNIAANVVGGGPAAVTALLLIPIQLRQLGVEAYGLIGFLVSIQVLFSLFDLGLSPAVTWYVARAGERGPLATRAVLRAVGPTYALVGV